MTWDKQDNKLLRAQLWIQMKFFHVQITPLAFLDVK